MTNPDKKFPPRVWIGSHPLAGIKVFSKETEEGAAFLSLEEHESIVREERAKAFEEAAEYVKTSAIYKTHPHVYDEIISKVAEIRGKK